MSATGEGERCFGAQQPTGKHGSTRLTEQLLSCPALDKTRSTTVYECRLPQESQSFERGLGACLNIHISICIIYVGLGGGVAAGDCRVASLVVSPGSQGVG